MERSRRAARDGAMIEDGKTARQLYAEAKASATRRRFGFGRRAALVNIDLQCAYTQVGTYATAYETDPRQIEHVNALARAFRARAWPVVWTYVAYLPSGEARRAQPSTRGWSARRPTS
jgi:hypothetical protein